MPPQTRSPFDDHLHYRQQPLTLLTDLAQPPSAELPSSSHMLYTFSLGSVGDNNITGEGADTLAKVVLEHKSLTNFCGIPLVSLRENTLKKLDLESEGVGVPGAIVLSRLLPAATLLTSIE